MEIPADRLTRETLAIARGGYMTPKRKDTLQAILDFNLRGVQPSLRTVGSTMKKSKSTIDDSVAALECGGYVTVMHRGRGLQVTDAGRKLLDPKCPKCGHCL